MLQKIKLFVASHKIISIIVVLLIAGGSYFFIKKNSSGEVSYITESVKIGNITTYITGTGQVEATNTITLKAGSSNDVNFVGVKAGDSVKKGKLIASVECSDEKMALENAKISLNKLMGAPDSLSLLQKQNSLTKSYNDGWNNVSSFIIEVSSLKEEIFDLYNNGLLSYKYTSSLSNTGKDKVILSENKFYEADKNINELIKLYKSLSRSSSREEINNLIDKSYESARILADSIKDTKTTFEYVVDRLDYSNNADAISSKSDIDSWVDSANGYVASLLSNQNSLNESVQSLDDLLEGADELDIRSAELSVSSKQKSYNDCFVYAPFDGVVGTLTAKVGESAGSSLGTLITTENIAVVSFNEVDVASIKVGQEATLTFDAIEGLKIEGEVIEMDSLGTVSSGVVTYNVKISFSENDERVKPGMSTNVEIITNSKENILTVSSSAIKTRNSSSYVEVLGDNSMVIRKPVEVGISDDTITEIISGLKEGDKVVTKTISSKSTTSTNLPQGGNNMMRAGNPIGGIAIRGIGR